MAILERKYLKEADCGTLIFFKVSGLIFLIHNDNLEAMAKQLYDYWFVQFDFPNEEGKPYKSSGGAMVWNDKLKREIPKEWMASNYTDLFTIGNGQTMPQNEGLVPAYGGNGIVKW